MITQLQRLEEHKNLLRIKALLKAAKTLKYKTGKRHDAMTTQ